MLVVLYQNDFKTLVEQAIIRGIEEDGKLLGSRRLATASNILLRTPGATRKATLGSTRLQQARKILLEAVQESNAKDLKMMGSRRLAKAKDILMYGVREIRKQRQSQKDTDRPVGSAATPLPIPDKETRQVTEQKNEVDVLLSDNLLIYGGRVATPQQLSDIADIRAKIAELAANGDGACTPWLQRLEDVDILRYVMWHKDASTAWGKLQATAKWREAEGIDGVLAENLDDVFEAGKEEMLYLPPDKLGRPVLLYRSALHKPGKIDPQRFTRYVIQQTERARLQYRLGTEVQSIVIVDRIGSGLKNQDPALLKVLLPVIVEHYPEYVGFVYVAPISVVFNVIWKIIQVARVEWDFTGWNVVHSFLASIATSTSPRNFMP
jgi:hypothetical protein